MQLLEEIKLIGTFGWKFKPYLEKWKEKISYFCRALAKANNHALFVFADEKKKTKKIENELNPVWNEVILKKKNPCSF